MASPGLYAAMEHRFREGGGGSPAIFTRWGWAPQSRNDIAAYVGAGIVCRGIGAGLTSVQLAASNRETVYELFYKRHLTRQISVQPDLQWVANAGGRGPSNLVAGVRMRVEF